MNFTRHSILIVDDQPANIQLLNGLLQEEYTVYFATSGEAALDVVEKQQPDMVLLDVVMPGMDGYETCQKIKELPHGRDITVIFVTSKDDAVNETKGLELGAIDYITKPVNASIVKMRVKNHLKLKRLQDELTMLSFVDGLTQVANRRRFDNEISREWLRCTRDSNPFSLMMIDVDNFKKFNDLYGHQEGDRCLRELARVMNGCIRRPGDLFARYGGEEFVCLLTDTDLFGMATLAEQLRVEVSDLAIIHEKNEAWGHVTVSIGGACVIPSTTMKIEDVIEQADKNLYRSKNQGRNCFTSGTD